MDNGTWLGQVAADDLTPMRRGLALAGMRDAAEDAAAERALAEKDATAADRREEFVFLNAQAGDPVGEMSRARQAWSDADDMRRDALDELRKAERRIKLAESRIEFWAARLA